MLSLWAYFCFVVIKLKNFFLICFVSILRFAFFPFKWCWNFFWRHTLSVCKRCWSYILVSSTKIFLNFTLKKKNNKNTDKINSMLEEIEKTKKKHKSKNIFSITIFYFDSSIFLLVSI